MLWHCIFFAFLFDRKFQSVLMTSPLLWHHLLRILHCWMSNKVQVSYLQGMLQTVLPFQYKNWSTWHDMLINSFKFSTWKNPIKPSKQVIGIEDNLRGRRSLSCCNTNFPQMIYMDSASGKRITVPIRFWELTGYSALGVYWLPK